MSGLQLPPHPLIKLIQWLDWARGKNKTSVKYGILSARTWRVPESDSLQRKLDSYWFPSILFIIWFNHIFFLFSFLSLFLFIFSSLLFFPNYLSQLMYFDCRFFTTHPEYQSKFRAFAKVPIENLKDNRSFLVIPIFRQLSNHSPVLRHPCILMSNCIKHQNSHHPMPTFHSSNSFQAVLVFLWFIFWSFYFHFLKRFFWRISDDEIIIRWWWKLKDSKRRRITYWSQLKNESPRQLRNELISYKDIIRGGSNALVCFLLKWNTGPTCGSQKNDFNSTNSSFRSRPTGETAIIHYFSVSI